MMDIATPTIIIGLLTIITNIGITFYNRGKNRKIYEIKSLYTGGEKNENDINAFLKNGNYTVLYVGQNFQDTRLLRYILGRVIEESKMNKKQLIVMWAVALAYCLALLYFMVKRIYIFYNIEGHGKTLSELFVGVYEVITMFFIPIFFIGGLLIYALRNKK